MRMLCFYTCLSVYRRGVCLSACWDTTPPPEQTPPRPGRSPGSRHPLDLAGTPRARQASPDQSTAADGMHRTGMHSFLYIVLPVPRNLCSWSFMNTTCFVLLLLLLILLCVWPNQQMVLCFRCQHMNIDNTALDFLFICQMLRPLHMLILVHFL